MYYLTSDYRVI